MADWCGWAVCWLCRQGCRACPGLRAVAGGVVHACALCMARGTRCEPLLYDWHRSCTRPAPVRVPVVLCACSIRETYDVLIRTLRLHADDTIHVPKAIAKAVSVGMACGLMAWLLGCCADGWPLGQWGVGPPVRYSGECGMQECDPECSAGGRSMLTHWLHL